MSLLSWEGKRHRPGGAWAVYIKAASVAAALYVLWVLNFAIWGVAGFPDGMSGLMISRRLLLIFGHHGRFALRPHQYLVFGPLEIVHRDDFLVVAGGVERGLVHQVGQVGAGESGRAAGDDLNVDVFA